MTTSTFTFTSVLPLTYTGPKSFGSCHCLCEEMLKEAIAQTSGHIYLTHSEHARLAQESFMQWKEDNGDLDCCTDTLEAEHAALAYLIENDDSWGN